MGNCITAKRKGLSNLTRYQLLFLKRNSSYLCLKNHIIESNLEGFDLVGDIANDVEAVEEEASKTFDSDHFVKNMAKHQSSIEYCAERLQRARHPPWYADQYVYYGEE